MRHPESNSTDYKDLTKYPFLFNLDSTGTIDLKVCVKECPDDNDNSVDCQESDDVSTCPTGSDLYDSSPNFGVCNPSNSTTLHQMEAKIASSVAAKVAKDNSVALSVCTATALFLCLGYIVLMSKQPEMLAKASVIFLEILYVTSIGAFTYLAITGSAWYWIVVGVTALGFLLFNCMLCVYRTQFKIGVAVIDSAADFLNATKRIIFISIFYFIIALMFIGGCVGTIFMYWTIA